MKKWRRSLIKKQHLFPDLYDFTDIISQNTILGLTDTLLRQYSNYPPAREYFKGYALVNKALYDLPIPTTLITAEDDPIIPVRDFHQLKLNGLTNLAIQRYGGHNGFLDGFRLKGWYEERMTALFDHIIRTSSRII